MQRAMLQRVARLDRAEDQSAGTGNRTRMGLPPRDFKSLASADFATPAIPRLRIDRITRVDLEYGVSGGPVPSAKSLKKAGNGTRTRDPNLGKVVLYQLSYSRATS